MENGMVASLVALSKERSAGEQHCYEDELSDSAGLQHSAQCVVKLRVFYATAKKAR